MTQPIWYDSGEAGAPTLNNVAGSLLEVLRACLINGFGSKTVTSIAVASGVATVTCAAHGFTGAYGKLVLISGSTEPLLNGNKQPGNVLTNSFTYAAPGVADGTYTGTLSAKRAPLGWTEPYTGTNVAMFARSAPEATSMLLRVNDSASAPATATHARALMVESATGVDAYTGPGPTEAQYAGGIQCNKGASSVTAKSWLLLGDDRGFYLFTGDPAATSLLVGLAFGDINSYTDADAYGCFISGTASTSTSTSSSGLTYNVSLVSVPSSAQNAMARLKTGVGGAVAFGLSGVASPQNIGGVDANMGTDVANFVVHRPLYLRDTSAGVRGHMPGLCQLLASQTVLTHLQQFTDNAGRRYLAIRVNNFSQITSAVLSLDDWRA